MNDKTDDDRDHVEAELLGGRGQVLDAHDLTSDQAHDTEWGVPVTWDPLQTVFHCQWINSLAPGRFEWYFWYLIFQII